MASVETLATQKFECSVNVTVCRVYEMHLGQDTSVGLVKCSLLCRGRDPRSNFAYLDLFHVPTGF